MASPNKDRIQRLALAARIVGKATKYSALIVLSGIVGAHIGTAVGSAFGAMLGTPAWWAVQGRCAGWVVFVLVAVVGAPFGFVYFYPRKPRSRKQSGDQRPTPKTPSERLEPVNTQKTITGIRAMIIAPLSGAFAGLIVGGMLGGYLVAIYFFFALSPLGTDGWWPIMQTTIRRSGDGFSAKDPRVLIPWLAIVGTCIALGALLGLCGTTTVGKTRYQVFGSRKDAANEDREI